MRLEFQRISMCRTSLIYINRYVIVLNSIVILPPIVHQELRKLEMESNNLYRIEHPLVLPNLQTWNMLCNDLVEFALPPTSNLSSIETIDLRMNCLRRITRTV